MPEHTLERMAQNATDARRAGDERLAEYWTLRVQWESDRQERAAHLHEWDSLKGSPEHG